MSETKEKICFVISPIGEDGTESRKRADQVLRHVIEPCVSSSGYTKIIRADQISNPGSITHQILDYIIKADLVIADLTGQNPNVFYELAVRHCSRKPIVQICDVNTKLPFDVYDQRTIFFDYKDLDSVEQAKETLLQYIQSAEQMKTMTPIHEALMIEGLLESNDPDKRVLGEIASNMAALTERVNQLQSTILKTSKNNTDFKVFDSSEMMVIPRETKKRGLLLNGVSDLRGHLTINKNDENKHDDE